MNEDQKIEMGFNDGYLLKQYDPELFDKLKGGFKETTDHYVQGFISGGQERQKEQGRNVENNPTANEVLRIKLRQQLIIRNKNRENDRDIGR